LRGPAKKSGRRTAPATLSARLISHVTLEAPANGDIAASFDGMSLGLGKFSAAAADRAQKLRKGLPLRSFTSRTAVTDKDIEQLVRRLAVRGLVEYPLTRARNGEDLVVIEPQVADYWPQMPPLRETDALVLSRFAYMRRRANEMVLESPRARALFKICDPKIAGALAALSTPQQVKRLRRQSGFPGTELLALLVDCQILFMVDAADDAGLRPAEGDDNLVLWDFHDLLFHTRSTEGRHANPAGGVYPFANAIAPLPAVRPHWPGRKIDLPKGSESSSAATSPGVKLLRDRHSTREFDDRRPMTLTELSQFLDGAARVHATFNTTLDLGDNSPDFSYAPRPYPSGGGSYELELYLAVDKCEGLPRGFYHYDAGGHALVRIDAPAPAFEALLKGAEFAMDAPGVPQVLITIAARFGRVSWKYSSIAYSLILKDVGVLMQTFYLTATDIGLGGCAIGSTNIDLFAKLTGLEFHVEGPVGLFALGRGRTTGAA
jgi:SagB-type dehydrogenase family enzyme